MRTLVKIFILFLALTGAATLLVGLFDFRFGVVDFWRVHGFLFLVVIAIFPRLTLLFSSVPFGGLFWWLGFFFTPRLLTAILATVAYWNTNKVLVVISWLFAVSGETAEKYAIVPKRER